MYVSMCFKRGTDEQGTCRLVSRRWNKCIISMLLIQSLVEKVLVNKVHIKVPIRVICDHRAAFSMFRVDFR